MKHYKSVEFLSVFRIAHKPKAPLQKRRAPPIEKFQVKVLLCTTISQDLEA